MSTRVLDNGPFGHFELWTTALGQEMGSLLEIE